MNAYLLKYRSLDIKDLLRIIEGYKDLLLPAKKALLQHIEELEDISEISTEKIEQIKASIEEDYVEIKDLKYFKRLGFGYYEEESEVIIKKNHIGRNRDRLSLILGILFSIMNIPAIDIIVANWGNLELPIIFVFVVLLIIGVNGIILLSKTLDRKIAFKRFSVIKSSNGVEINHNPENREKHQNYSSSCKLAVTEEGEYIKLVLRIENEKSVDILKFTKLEPLLIDSLKYATIKFNNWQ